MNKKCAVFCALHWTRFQEERLFVEQGAISLIHCEHRACCLAAYVVSFTAGQQSYRVLHNWKG